MTPNDVSIDEQFDVIVIGGGFYGLCIAEFFKSRGARKVAVLEQHEELMQRASYVNQARVHGGYHYPRSFLTAKRSWRNFSRFVDDFKASIVDEFDQVYAVAANGSKVSAQQFQTFCRHIGARLTTAPPKIVNLFESRFVEGVFLTSEVAFDAGKLKTLMEERLGNLGVEVKLSTTVISIKAADKGGLVVNCSKADPQSQDDDAEVSFKAKTVINCSYAGINECLARSELPLLPLKHELAEIALIEPPPELARLGVTVIDGPFFSTMPFPAGAAHSLTHVRYTPHKQWGATVNGDPAAAPRFGQMPPDEDTGSRVVYMMRDAARYLPSIGRARHLSSVFEVKTLQVSNEVDDGRPILFRKDYGGLDDFYVVMGGKMDNVYDAIETFSRLGY